MTRSFFSNISFPNSSKKGFTLIEILITVTIISVLSVTAVMVFRTSLSRGRDAERKSDLESIYVAFEDYYNDNGCYPPATTSLFTSCGQSFRPYLDQVPCDPMSDEPYLYVPNTNECTGYRLYASLERQDDADSQRLGCDGANGCGYDPDYNYGVSAGVPVRY